jgi:hypothetical protein
LAYTNTHPDHKLKQNERKRKVHPAPLHPAARLLPHPPLQLNLQMTILRLKNKEKKLTREMMTNSRKVKRKMLMVKKEQVDHPQVSLAHRVGHQTKIRRKKEKKMEANKTMKDLERKDRSRIKKMD